MMIIMKELGEIGLKMDLKGKVVRKIMTGAGYVQVMDDDRVSTRAMQ